MKHVTRRNFLHCAAGASTAALALSSQSCSRAEVSKLGMPGLHPGRVVAVHHPASIVDGLFGTEPIREMISTGMRDLTGASDLTAAWKQFVEPGDVVGIKVNPVGAPHVISCGDVLREIIAGLRSAGVKARDIVVYDRYRAQFLKAGFDKWLPEGVRWMSVVEDYDPIQHAIEGYDPDHYMEMALTHPGYDISNKTAIRSYAARFITREVNKLINLPVLKDHQSAGVTLALKNLSHGLVNNVSRSHSSKTLNACGAFIPAVCAMPVIRNKTVLHVLDGIKGLYHGGPGARKDFVWEHKTMYFATDPVALDRVGWEQIDEKRLDAGMPTIARDRPDEFSTFLSRQPEHVELAGALGLGVWERDKIQIIEKKLQSA